MRRRSIVTVLAALVLACAFGGAGKSVIAGTIDEARPEVNPFYLAPFPENPWGHVPACQVIVKAAFAVGAVTPDDLYYCRLPPEASRHASDPCSCVVRTGDARVLRHGMVVWRPQWYLKYILLP